MSILSFVMVLLELLKRFIDMAPDKRSVFAAKIMDSARHYEKTGDTTDLGQFN